MNKIESLARLINKFDWGYEMSDSYTVYDEWQRNKREIKQALATLTEAELNVLYSNISEYGLKNVERYFKGYFSKPEMLSNCCGAPSKGGEDYGICSECGEHCEYSDNNE